MLTPTLLYAGLLPLAAAAIIVLPCTAAPRFAPGNVGLRQQPPDSWPAWSA